MPISTSQVEKYSIRCLWDEHLSYNFNAILSKKIFRDTGLSLITGSDNGNVRVHKSVYKNGTICGFEKTSRSFETKGGPIQALLSKNVTNFASEDILIGDSNGTFTIITNGQILNRRCLCDSKITAVVMDTDSAGNMSIVMGSSEGSLVAVTPYDILWKCRLSEALKQEEQASEDSVSITALHVLHMHSSTTDASYVIVADSEKRLHFFQNGILVMTLSIPSVATSMCTGFFVNENHSDLSTNASSPPKGQKYSYDEQVAIATKSGAIFILSNFTIIPYSNLSFPLTQIKVLPASGSDDLDAILCAGHFNKLCILQNKVCVSVFQTNDWIQTFDIIDAEFSGDGMFIVLGCLDYTVKLVKLEKNR